MHMVRVFPIPGVDDLVNTSGISTTDRGIHSGNIVCEYIYIYVYTHDIMIWFIDVFSSEANPSILNLVQVPCLVELFAMQKPPQVFGT